MCILHIILHIDTIYIIHYTLYTLQQTFLNVFSGFLFFYFMQTPCCAVILHIIQIILQIDTISIKHYTHCKTHILKSIFWFLFLYFMLTLRCGIILQVKMHLGFIPHVCKLFSGCKEHVLPTYISSKCQVLNLMVTIT